MSSQDSSDPAAACPVDHKAREAWLKQARAQNAAAQPPHPIPPTSAPKSAPLQSASCDSSQLDKSLSPSSNAPTTSRLLGSIRGGGLGTDREISTIPRAALTGIAAEQRPANNEKDTGADKKTGNWIYPSEQMFFDAMKRKAYNPEQADMRTIVPIHNAVNERAWMEIKAWEKGRGSESCGGPRLESFSGLSTSLTPRARWNTLLGYKPPFDRHDWIVDRCGTKVEYVIDFYAGKDEGRPGKELNFFLDVRPKLNSWEGMKLRAQRFVGL
ncbi:cytochrome c and c1 heme-lyase [Massarina eburnea CBS 473.64]|uniref:Holocytochrome c-type synthase n=1 Tax=Massarina eburnea CBS 473.64 TaxID=1395130 RepID=A0A6A6S5Q9_9PLEO|nr:cytochrome c and c1 heme-lyase [Massarina eburnea CBS 473.64]